MTVEDERLWKSIDEEAVLSSDGKWVAYTVVEPLGDIELIVRSIGERLQYRMLREARVDPADIEKGRGRLAGRTWPVHFSSDSRFILFTIEDARASRRSSTNDWRMLRSVKGTVTKEVATKAAKEVTKDSVVSDAGGSGQDSTTSAEPALIIMRLSDGQVTEVPGVSAFVLPEQSERHVAYRRAQCGASHASRCLILHDMQNGIENAISDVSEFTFDKSGKHVAYVADASNSTKKGVYIRRLNDGHTAPVLTGTGDYRNVAFDEKGRQLAFLSGRENIPAGATEYDLYLTRSLGYPAEPVVTANQVPAGQHIDPDAGVNFVPNGNALVFKVRSASVSASPIEPKSAGAKFDLWHWQNPFTPPELGKPGNGLIAREMQQPTYLSVYHIPEKRWVQLERAGISTVRLGDDARYAIGYDGSQYLLGNRGWNDSYVDLHRIDPHSGHATLIRRRLPLSGTWMPTYPDPVRISASARYMLFFENRRWFSYDQATNQVHDLTGMLLPTVHFEIDRQAYPPSRPAIPVGIAGWTEGEKNVVIYDQRDIWEFDPQGKAAPSNLTAGIGRDQDVELRFWRPRDARTTPTRDLTYRTKRLHLLTATNWQTGAIGLWEWQGFGSIPKPLLMKERKITLLDRSESGSEYLLTQENFQEFPNLWVGKTLDKLERISDVNPQQAQFRWGQVRLVNYTSSYGVPLTGLLYLPDDFDPRRRYPLIVEPHGGVEERYQYQSPNIRGIPFSPFPYLSQGYLIFRPKIIPAAPHRGESALASVVRGTETIIDMNFVDPTRICLTGFSWSGELTNYIITRTSMFRCAVEAAGAAEPMTGYTYRPWAYERTAMQYDASPWDEPSVYVSNSAVLRADRVRTPILIMHNEADEAVPFVEGRAFFMALRRNGKEAYMLSYHGATHAVLGYANALDWRRRRQEFFDHYLKNAPKPTWMSAY